MKTVVVTGAAGFIGAAVSARMLADGWRVVGIDSLNDYYDPALKKQRVAVLKKHPKAKHFVFKKLDLVQREKFTKLLQEEKPELVIHLAAQASVRYGLKNPLSYLERNLVGHFNVLEAMRQAKIGKLLYASSSSVYGANEKVPFSESDDVSRPVSLYAATKRADELITHAWCHQFGLKAAGLRFFTVYGPWGRPDMSPVIFASAIFRRVRRSRCSTGVTCGATLPLWMTLLRLWCGWWMRHLMGMKFSTWVTRTPCVLMLLSGPWRRCWGVLLSLTCNPGPPPKFTRPMPIPARLKAKVGWAPSTPLETGSRKFAEWFVPWHAKKRV